MHISHKNAYQCGTVCVMPRDQTMGDHISRCAARSPARRTIAVSSPDSKAPRRSPSLNRSPRMRSVSRRQLVGRRLRDEVDVVLERLRFGGQAPGHPVDRRPNPAVRGRGLVGRARLRSKLHVRHRPDAGRPLDRVDPRAEGEARPFEDRQKVREAAKVTGELEISHSSSSLAETRPLADSNQAAECGSNAGGQGEAPSGAFRSRSAPWNGRSRKGPGRSFTGL